jgi:hypothetical protein
MGSAAGADKGPVSAFELVRSLVLSVIWVGGWAQLIGIPIAWLRLRRTRGWADRPREVRSIELLAEFVWAPTFAAVAWGWALILIAALGGLGLSGATLVVLMFGAPAIFVPWAVANLELRRFPHVAMRARERRRPRFGESAQRNQD